jgi:6-pyruvoyltetrahydropterin/6-carboxytetrahydropterin synthase
LKYQVIKTYGNETGHSCAFRQWRADSHCNLIHGYALGFEITFEAAELNEQNWVIDFGDLGILKQYLKDTFDHTTIIADDDPEHETFLMLQNLNLINLKVMDNVGCEAFAENVFDFCYEKFSSMRVDIKSVKVFEHGSNSAVFGNF